MRNLHRTSLLELMGKSKFAGPTRALRAVKASRLANLPVATPALRPCEGTGPLRLFSGGRDARGRCAGTQGLHQMLKKYVHLNTCPALRIVTHMTYEECLVTRQMLDQDRRFTGSVFSRKQWSTDHYSVSLQLRNGQEFEFCALQDFRRWHARYRISRQARGQTSALILGAPWPARRFSRFGAI